MKDPVDPFESADVLSVVEETASIGVAEIETGRVRVTTSTALSEKMLKQDLMTTRTEVTRVPVDRMIEEGETLPTIRTEGNVTIIPIFEEIVTVRKRLVLKEELRITGTETTRTVEVPVALRKQSATIERLPGED